MPDYNNGKIYKLVSQSGLVYIGSTTKTLNYRLSLHKCCYKRWKVGKFNYLTSFKVLDDGDATIELLEEYPCKTRKELENRERFYIETNKCVNKCIPTRTMTEYYEENKNQILKWNAKYHETNKDAIDAKRKVRHDCDCHGKYTTANKQIHFKSKKHLEYFESL